MTKTEIKTNMLNTWDIKFHFFLFEGTFRDNQRKINAPALHVTWRFMSVPRRSNDPSRGTQEGCSATFDEGGVQTNNWLGYIQYPLVN